MSKSQEKKIIKEIEDLLNKQTIVILSAVDEKIKESEVRINNKVEKVNSVF